MLNWKLNCSVKSKEINITKKSKKKKKRSIVQRLTKKKFPISRLPYYSWRAEGCVRN